MHELQREYEQHIETLVGAAHRLAFLGYVASHGGNLSCRLADNLVAITPTKLYKGELTFDDITLVDMSGAVMYAADNRAPTGETPLHLRLLSRRPDLRALVHAHPPALTGLAMARDNSLALPLLPEPVVEVGPVAAVPYVEPVSDTLAEAFDRVADTANAYLMYNHGVMLGGVEDSRRVVDILQMLETAAESVAVAAAVGGLVALTPDDVARLDDVRARRGLPLPGAPGVHNGLVEAYRAACDGAWG